MKTIYKIIYVILGLVLVTVLAANYVLTFKAKEVLQELVSQLSDDTYRLEAKKVTFFFRKTGIHAEQIKLVPNSRHEKQGTLSVEKVEIRLHSLWQLLWHNRLEVANIEFIKPNLITYEKLTKQDAPPRDISESIHQIQLKLFELFEVLNVKKFSMTGAALKIYSADSGNASYFAVNHLNIDLHDIQIFPSADVDAPPVMLSGSISLLSPDIHLADSNLSVKLGRLHADVSNAGLAIDKLDFSIAGAENKTQKLLLSSVRINHLNWDRFIKEGIIELDTVVVNKGSADICLITRSKENPDNTSQNAMVHKGNSLIVHHTFISDIAYRLTNFQSQNGKQNKILLNLQGDSMYLNDFSLIHGRSPAFAVSKMAIGIKHVKERDSEDNAHISLDALTLDSQSLLLKNYLLETNPAITNKNYFRIAIPEFKLNSYSLEAIFQKRLSASEMHLLNPDITIDIRKKKIKKTGGNLDALFAGLMENVSKKATLKEIAIENASITLLPTLSPEDKINVSGLSIIMDAGKFPGIKDVHDFIHAIRKLDSKGFSVKGKDLDLTIRDMQLLKVPRGIYFGSVAGHWGHGKAIDLKGVTVLINDSISNYARKSDFHLSGVFAESGTVALEIIKTGTTGKTAGNNPSLLIDTLDLRNVKFTMRQNNKVGISSAMTLAARDLAFRDKALYWTTLDVSAAGPNADLGQTTFKAGSLHLLQPGIIQIHHATGSQTNAQSSIDFSTQSLDITLGLHSTHWPSLIIDALKMTKPALNIALRQPPKVRTVSKKHGKAIIQDILLKKLLVTEPSVNFTLSNSEGKQISVHKVYTGSFLLEDIHTLNQPEVYVGKLIYKTNNPKTEIRGFNINPSSLYLSLSHLKFNTISRHYSLHVDSAIIQDISHTMVGKNQDTIHLHAGEIGAGHFDYAKGDSLSLDKLLYGTNWWAKKGNLTFSTPKQIIAAWQISLAGNQSVNMELDSFAITNRLSKEAVWQSTPFEKSYETISGGKLRLFDMRLQMAGKEPFAEVSKIHTQNLHFTTSKDKTKLEDTISFRPMLTQMFTRLPLKLKIDSLLLNNARVDVHEVSKKTKKETHIFFSETDGYLKNIKTWDVKAKDTFEMRAKTRFYGTDALRLHFKQSYDDTLQGFWMRARMSHFNMPEMNKLLTPLMGIEIKSGTIDSLLLVANGNDYFSFGTMDLRYHNLRAKLLITEETKGKFLVSIENFIAGLLLRKHDNGRTNLLFKERLRKRSIFNFWAKIGLEGLLSNLGIKSDRKERKRFEKSIEKYNLPEKYWEDIDD